MSIPNLTEPGTLGNKGFINFLSHNLKKNSGHYKGILYYFIRMINNLWNHNNELYLQIIIIYYILRVDLKLKNLAKVSIPFY